MLAFLSFHRSALTLVSVAFSRLSNQEVSEFSVSGRSKAYRRLVKKDECVYTIEIYNRGMSHFNNVLMNLNVVLNQHHGKNYYLVCVSFMLQ